MTPAGPVSKHQLWGAWLTQWVHPLDGDPGTLRQTINWPTLLSLSGLTKGSHSFCFQHTSTEKIHVVGRPEDKEWNRIQGAEVLGQKKCPCHRPDYTMSLQGWVVQCGGERHNFSLFFHTFNNMYKKKVQIVKKVYCFFKQDIWIIIYSDVLCSYIYLYMPWSSQNRF